MVQLCSRGEDQYDALIAHLQVVCSFVVVGGAVCVHALLTYLPPKAQSTSSITKADGAPLPTAAPVAKGNVTLEKSSARLGAAASDDGFFTRRNS